LESIISTSIVGRARERGQVEIILHNLHDYATDKYRHIDDTPYGGGAGMIIQCEPVFECIEALLRERTYDDVIYLCPDGEVLTQESCNTMSLAKNLILLCGHYKGIDQRIRDVLVTREISIGDYVLTNGAIAANVVTDAVVRLVPGVLGDERSAEEESFSAGLLEAPAYTRPPEFRGMKVPDVLLGGNHARIAAWKREQALLRTTAMRPDLLD
jgi:tRNA (guanine37-N1)-methyltransferase